MDLANKRNDFDFIHTGIPCDREGGWTQRMLHPCTLPGLPVADSVFSTDLYPSKKGPRRLALTVEISQPSLGWLTTTWRGRAVETRRAWCHYPVLSSFCLNQSHSFLPQSPLLWSCHPAFTTPPPCVSPSLPCTFSGPPPSPPPHPHHCHLCLSSVSAVSLSFTSPVL